MIIVVAMSIFSINIRMNTDKTNVINVDVSSDIRNMKYVLNGFI